MELLNLVEEVDVVEAWDDDNDRVRVVFPVKGEDSKCFDFQVDRDSVKLRAKVRLTLTLLEE
jgi:hypothetical protein